MMILKQKKNTEVIERRMDVNKKYSIKYYFIEIVIMLATVSGMWFLGCAKGQAADRVLANCVMAAFGVAIVGFQLRRTYFSNELDYDNEYHLGRFFSWFSAGVFISFGCAFLPVAGWPFVPLFVLLSLFSDIGTGILSS